MGGNWEAREEMSDDRDGARKKDPKRRIGGSMEDMRLKKSPLSLFGALQLLPHKPLMASRPRTPL